MGKGKRLGTCSPFLIASARNCCTSSHVAHLTASSDPNARARVCVCVLR